MRNISYRSLAIALLMSAPALLPAQQWSTISPQGLTANLYGLNFLDDRTGWIVGWGTGYSVLGRTTDGGANWQGWNMPNTLLFDVLFQDTSSGSIVGYHNGCACGLLLQTSDAGVTWNERTFDLKSGIYSFGFYRILFTTPLTGYISGYNSALLKTTDGGTTWKRGAIESTHDVFRVLEFADPMTGYAAAGDDFSLMYRIYRTDDAGESWELVKDFQQTVSIGGMAFLDPRTGFIAGNGEGGGLISKTTDAGVTWRRVYSGPASEVMQSIRFADLKNGYAVGSDGAIVMTTDGGETWTKEPSPTTTVLTGVAPGMDGSVYVVGFDGTVLKRSGSAATVAPNLRSPRSVMVTPNPFRFSTRISLDDAEPAGPWKLTLRDLMGTVVRTLEGEGGQSMIVERDGLAAGTYFYTLVINGRMRASGMMTAH